MKRFTTPSHLDSHPIQFQIGALLGYYQHAKLVKSFLSALPLDCRDAYRYGVDHGRLKRSEDEAAGKVVRL